MNKLFKVLVVIISLLFSSNVFANNLSHMLNNTDELVLKVLYKTDLIQDGPGQRVIKGTVPIKELLGTPSEKVKYTLDMIYMSDDGVEEKDTVEGTWFETKYVSNDKNRSMHRLYYQKNEVMPLAEAGDILAIIKKSKNEILLLIVEKDSDAEKELFETLGIETHKDKSIFASIFSSDDEDEDEEEIEEVIEDELVKSDVEVLRDEKNKKLVIIGKVSKFQDGDSFVLGELFKVRMLAIDTPEKKQMCKDKKGVEFNCGKASSEHLKKLIGKGDISCEMNGWGSFNRHLFVCKNSKGIDINKQMVVDGYAVMSTYKPFLYEKEELEAKNNKKGLWSGTFQHPSDYRKDKRKK